MSKAQENLIVQLDRAKTEIAFRKAAMSLGTIRELEEGHFQIKETDNGYSAGTVTMGNFGAAFSTDKITNPATVDIYINTKTVQQTEIIIIASCFGIGPIQNNHCKSKLSTVKSAIMVAISEYSQNATIANQPSNGEVDNQKINSLQDNSNTVTITPTQPIVDQPPIVTVNREVRQQQSNFIKFEICAIVFTSLSLFIWILPLPLYMPAIVYNLVALIVSAPAVVLSVICFKNNGKNQMIKIILIISAMLTAIRFSYFIQSLFDLQYYTFSDTVFYVIAIILAIKL